MDINRKYGLDKLEKANTYGSSRSTSSFPSELSYGEEVEEIEESEASEYEEDWWGEIEDEANLPVGDLRHALWLLFEDPFTQLPGSAKTLTVHNLRKAARINAVFTLILILTSTIFNIAETQPENYVCREDTFWRVSNGLFATLFTVEFFFRLYSCPKLSQFVKDWLNLFDLLAILPYFIGLTSNEVPYFHLRVLRLVRAVRILYAMRLSTTIDRNIDMILCALRKSREVLILYGCVLLVTVVVWSSAIYYIERNDSTWDAELEVYTRKRRDFTQDPNDPDANGTLFFVEESPFQSIFHSLWWCMATLATVGYGDLVPISIGGKIIAGCTMISGIFVLALPTSILASNYLAVYREHHMQESKQNAEPITIQREVQDNRLMESIYWYLEKVTEQGVVSQRNAEYMRRALWHPVYVKRVIWSYKTSLMHDVEYYKKLEIRIRYVGIVLDENEILSPEVKMRYGQNPKFVGTEELEVNSVISFTIVKDEDSDLIIVKNIADLQPHQLEVAREGVNSCVQGLWLCLSKNDASVKDIYRKQLMWSQNIETVEFRRASRFGHLVKLIANHLGTISSKNGIRNLSDMMQAQERFGTKSRLFT
eukprot:TRINITY_DN37051_c0_g1_i1.p1 TRINITY_DN37051_c0_g1~~TRINITY_DN37051_c0_g1_i1.p1  ORF type:complete len:595 (+),score=92.09 TRINITY_DN37051_c0_g1_i1:163-1947(+)